MKCEISDNIANDGRDMYSNGNINSSDSVSTSTWKSGGETLGHLGHNLGSGDEAMLAQHLQQYAILIQQNSAFFRPIQARLS